MKQIWMMIIAVALAVWSCSNNDDQSAPVDYHLSVGDSAITIPNAAIEFAKAQFSVHAYLLREYQIARDPSWPHPGATYTGMLIDWKALGWAARQTFLLPPYTHDVKTADAAQYYYMIGTYFDQFGYGWHDTYDPEANVNDPDANIWLHPADSTLTPDNTTTIGFDGGCRFIGQYRAMWTIQL